MPKTKKTATRASLKSKPTAKFDEDLTETIALAVASIVTEKRPSLKKINALEGNVSPGQADSLARVTSTDKNLVKVKNAKSKSTKGTTSDGKPSKVKKKKVRAADVSPSKILVKECLDLIEEQKISSSLTKVKSQSSSSKNLVKKESSSKNIVFKGQSSSKKLVVKDTSSSKSLVKGQSSEKKLKGRKKSQKVNDLDALLAVENCNEPIEVSHESILCRNDKPVPPLIKDANGMETSLYLARVQGYFDQLGYHRVGEPAIRVNTRLSIKHLMETSRDLIKAGDPIKCLHALILAVHFTNNCSIIERFPLHFKSKVNGREYKHVVLGIYAQGYFGTLGISRDPGLQDKTPSFARLSDLIHEFYKCYTDSGHELLEVKIGAIITHDVHSMQTITWKLGIINFRTSPDHVEMEIERCSKKLRSLMGLACLRCVRPNPISGGFESQHPSKSRPFGSTNTSRSKGFVAVRHDPKSISLIKTRSRAIPKSKNNN